MTAIIFSSVLNMKMHTIYIYIYVYWLIGCFIPNGDLWVQSPMIIVGQSPKIAGDRDLPTEAYRRVMSTWPSMMVGTAEGDLPKLFSPALLAQNKLSKLNYIK